MGMAASYVSMPEHVWAAVAAKPDEARDMLYGYPNDPPSFFSWDLDKAWDAIRVLLAPDTGDNQSVDLADPVFGGQETGVDIGQGAARLFNRDRTAQIAARLDQITFEALFAGYDGDAFMQKGVYPEIWDEPDDDTADYVGEYYRALRTGFQHASSNGHVVLTRIA
jgi:hypothetical protein